MFWPITISREKDYFVTNNIYYHGFVNFYHCDWLMARTLNNPHARTLLTIDSGVLVVVYNVYRIVELNWKQNSWHLVFQGNWQKWEKILDKKKIADCIKYKAQTVINVCIRI